MYKIRFYADKNGKSDVREYIEKLHSKTGKDARIRSNKINEYFTVLANRGTRAGLPYVKHIDGEIWELRPLDDRFMFAALIENQLVVLHQFRKTTQKTPQREIEKAKRELKDLKERMEKK